MAMGWACSFEIASLKAALSESGLFWLAGGGLVYTVGIVFYTLDKIRYLTHAHGRWLFFVLIGTGCHFVSIIGYVR